MSLYDREDFEAFLLTFPHVEIVRQWGDASVGKVGPKGSGKIFALLSDWSAVRPALSFKCAEMSFQLLSEMEGVRPAPYLARAKWVQAARDCALSEEDLQAYIKEAHRLVSQALPLRVRVDLGIG